MEKCLEKLIDELQHLQHGLDPELRTDRFIHNKLINACQNIPAYQYACFKPADSLAGLINDLRSSIITYTQANPTNEAFFTDRRYHKYDRRFDNSQSSRSRPTTSYNGRKKKCFVCHKEGCWSSKHTKEERDESRNRFKDRLGQRFDKKAAQYIANFEGMESGSDNDLDDGDLDEMEALIIDVPSPPSATLIDENSEAFFTSLGLVEKAEEMATTLADRSFSHSLFTIGKVSPNATCNTIDSDPFAYIATDRYSSDKFYGIMIDTGASKHSTAGYGQYMAYTRDIKDTTIDISKADAIHVQFGIGSISSMGSVIIQTPIGHIEFHIVKADTPFLLCLADMDRLGVYFNNIDNSLVMKSTRIPVIRRFDHPFLLWESSLNSFITQSFAHNPCYLTETELRQLHRRFGHPSAMKLWLLLERSGHEVLRNA